MKDFAIGLVGVSLAVLFSVGILWGMIWGWQYFKVFKAEYSGKAVLAEAEYSRQVAVKEAQAKKDSSILLAEAEVERARGVAQANEIIADGLKNNEEYLRYLWIENMSNQNKEVIYIPTEAGLPILEAGKR